MTDHHRDPLTGLTPDEMDIALYFLAKGHKIGPEVITEAVEDEE